MSYIEWEVEIHPDKRDAAFYANGEQGIVVGVIRSKDMVAWEPIYLYGEMKCLVDRSSDPDYYEVVRRCDEWESVGIKNDADLEAAENAGRLEWEYNAWFEIFDNDGIYSTIDELIETAKTYNFE